MPTLQPTATEIPTSTPTAVVASTPASKMTPSATLVPTDTPAATSTPTATGTAAVTARVPRRHQLQYLLRFLLHRRRRVRQKRLHRPIRPSPSPTPNPLDGVRFVDEDNEDCLEGISRELLPTMELVIEDVDASHLVVVEVADEGHERQQGLMCRETVPSGSGMLFVFESARPLNFWMFNTYVPLDIVYLDESRNVVRAVRMEPCPRPEGADDSSWRSTCSTASIPYGSGVEALYALELPAGWLASIGLEFKNLEGVEVSW